MSAHGASARRFTTVKHWMSVALLVREAAVGDDDDEQQCRLRGARPMPPAMLAHGSLGRGELGGREAERTHQWMPVARRRRTA